VTITASLSALEVRLLDNGGAGLELVQRPVPEVLAALPFAADGGLAEQVVRHEEDRWPGRPEAAATNAASTSSSTRWGVRMRRIHFSLPENKLSWSSSWKALRPEAGVSTSCTIATMAVLAFSASASGATSNAAAGPFLACHHTSNARRRGRTRRPSPPPAVLLPVRHLPDPPGPRPRAAPPTARSARRSLHLVALQRGSYLIGDCGLMASHLHYTSITLAVFRSPSGLMANTSAAARREDPEGDSPTGVADGRGRGVLGFLSIPAGSRAR